MAAEEWFRRTTWTKDDEEQFFLRLGKSRGSFHKAQYCRIQAGHLSGTHKLELVEVALTLLEKIQAEWPKEEAASVWSQKAECYELLGRRELAIECYKKVFEVQRVQKGSRTTAHLSFAWLVATKKINELYEEAIGVLDEFALPIEFPVDKFKANAARALIISERGDTKAANRYAQLALEGMAQTSSGFAYHKSVGLVNDPDEAIVRQLRALAKT